MIRILFALLLLVPVSAFSFQNEPTGFRNISWNSSISKIAGFRPAGEPSGTVQRYMKMDETFPLEGITLSDVQYVTDAGKFIEAVALFECSQYGPLKKNLKHNYGAATATAQKGGSLSWQGPVTTITLNPPVVAKGKAPNAEPPLCSLTYSSTPHLKKITPQGKGN
jgi:hypothetical protein